MNCSFIIRENEIDDVKITPKNAKDMNALIKLTDAYYVEFVHNSITNFTYEN